MNTRLYFYSPLSMCKPPDVSATRAWRKKFEMQQHVGVGASKFWGCEGFLLEFPQTCPKVIVQLHLQIFSHKDHEDLFLVWPPKKRSSFVFLKNCWRQFCPDFQEFCPDFRQFKSFGAALAPLAPPSPTSLQQHIWGKYEQPIVGTA